MQKVVISDPKSGKAYSIELDEIKSKIIQGHKINKVLDASPLGLNGYEIKITGGSDKDGFPLRHDLEGKVRPRLLLSKGPGYHPIEHGIRRRKRVRGNVITPEIVQVNTKIVKNGKKSIEELLGKEEVSSKKETSVEKIKEKKSNAKSSKKETSVEKIKEKKSNAKPIRKETSVEKKSPVKVESNKEKKPVTTVDKGDD